MKYTLLGVAFGFCFPVMATLIEWPNKPELGLFELHLQTPLLLIIDTAPFFLGLFSFFLGKQTERNLAGAEKHRRAVEEHSNELEERNQQLTELNEVLDGMVYTASHDLKTPVVNFQSMLSMLQTVRHREGSEEMVDEIIGRMEKATGKFQEIIASLLEVSQVDRKLGEDVEEVDLKELLEGVKENLSEEIARREAVIRSEFSTVPKVNFSKSGLERIIQNLLSNSLKYTHPERRPEISLRSKRVASFVQLTFQDNGIGIDTEKQKGKLFKMFTRLHGNDLEGSGIGLYIVKRTLESSGGRIEVESTPGQGTTFYIYIPFEQ